MSPLRLVMCRRLHQIFCGLNKDTHQMTKRCKYHPLKTCNNDGITFGKFLPSEASAILGCPKLEFRAPVGALWWCSKYYADLPPQVWPHIANHPGETFCKSIKTWLSKAISNVYPTDIDSMYKAFCRVLHPQAPCGTSPVYNYPAWAAPGR